MPFVPTFLLFRILRRIMNHSTLNIQIFPADFENCYRLTTSDVPVFLQKYALDHIINITNKPQLTLTTIKLLNP